MARSIARSKLITSIALSPLTRPAEWVHWSTEVPIACTVPELPALAAVQVNSAAMPYCKACKTFGHSHRSFRGGCAENPAQVVECKKNEEEKAKLLKEQVINTGQDAGVPVSQHIHNT